MYVEQKEPDLFQVSTYSQQTLANQQIIFTFLFIPLIGLDSFQIGMDWKGKVVFPIPCTGKNFIFPILFFPVSGKMNFPIPVFPAPAFPISRT